MSTTIVERSDTEFQKSWSMGRRKPTAHQHVVPDSKATCQTEMATATAATGNGHKARPNATSTHTDTEASTVSQLLVSKLKLSVFHSLSRDVVHWNVLPSTRKKNSWILFAVQLYNFIHLMLDAALISFHAWLIVSFVSFFFHKSFISNGTTSLP